MENEALEVVVPIQGRILLLVMNVGDMASAIEVELKRNGYRVNVAAGLPPKEQIRAGHWSLIVLDRSLCGSDTLPSVEIWRQHGIKIPVLLISERVSAEEIAYGLKSGADDYLTKPFELVELTARVEALLRRLADLRSVRLSFNDLEIDLIKQKAYRKGQALNLLPREIALLEYFLSRPNQTITRAMLLKDVWQQNTSAESNAIDVHISNLRKKIDDRGRPSRIATIRGVGFILCNVE